MFIRADLKAEAKSRLKGYYWKAFVVCLIAATVTGAGGSSYGSNGITEWGENGFHISPQLLWITFGIVSLSVGVSLLVKLFAGNHLLVGRSYFFLKSREVPSDILDVSFGFKEGRYVNILKTMFIKDLFIGLWSLLFVIPGIIKSYEYYMVPYILAENPEIYYKDALEMSKNMMQGNKMDTFVLELSFLGLDLLGLLLCCVGITFVAPYKQATYTELYLALKSVTVRYE